MNLTENAWNIFNQSITDYHKKDDVNALPPCAECMRQSRSTYHAARVRPLQFAEDPSLAAELETMSLERMMAWTAEWIAVGGETLDKPTGFARRDGRF